MFKTVLESISTEIVEKKSRFIATMCYIESQEEADQIIKETKKKYHDARHNCVAYRVIENDNLIEKSSDDGEPSGTAGAPMLDIIRKQNLCNVLVIVTRYFGGILLGTGGLVRAYSEATINAIEKSKIVCMAKGYEMQVQLEYSMLEAFKYYCKNKNIQIKNLDYSDVIVCNIDVEEEKKEELLRDIEQKKLNVIHLNELRRKLVNI